MIDDKICNCERCTRARRVKDWRCKLGFHKYNTDTYTLAHRETKYCERCEMYI